MRQDSPIRQLSDLKGRKLGVGAMTWGNLPLSRAMLASVGVVCCPTFVRMI